MFADCRYNKASLSAVEINELLAAFDRAAANLLKLEKILDRAEAFIPKGPTAGSLPSTTTSAGHGTICARVSPRLMGGQ